MKTLREGDKGIDVTKLQSALVRSGYGPLFLDGDFGPATAHAVLTLQRVYLMNVDGVVGPKTWAALGVYEEDERYNRYAHAVRAAWMSYEHIIMDECYEMEIEPETALAIIAVESAGRGLTNAADPLPVIRFENHLFSAYVPREVFDRLFMYNRDKRWTGHEYRATPHKAWQSVHTGEQESEYGALLVASSLTEDGAYRSISMGAGQILGSWAGRLGYEDAPSMFTAFKSEEEQIRALFRFLRTGSNSNRNPDGDLWKDAKSKDWLSLAGQYNGRGQASAYASRIQEAYDAAVALLKV